MEGTGMKSRILIGLITVLISFFIPNGQVVADSTARGILEMVAPGQEGRIQSVSEGEIKIFAVKDGVLLGESTIQLQEMDVIIQLKEEPLIRMKNLKGVSMEWALADRERDLNQVKAEVLRLEDNARRTQGLSLRSPQEIIKKEFTYVFNGIAARVTRETAKEIGKHPQVKKVWRDGKVEAFLNESVPLIRANRVWTDLGVTGRGVIVAIVDTGIDYTHPDLGGCLGPSCKVMGGYDFSNNDSDPWDDHGHGTHVAGIVAANGAIKGVAPEAKLLAFKVLDYSGSGSFSTVIAGIERAVQSGADVINMSLGGPGDPDDPLAQAADNAVAAGVVVVVAAGNSGPDYQTLGSPGLARQALTVGASDKSDQIARFSSRGPAPLTLQIKPEVTGPGVSITSTVPHAGCSLCDPSGYKALSGTSMASPHVAGAAALLLERFPSWTPQQVKEALMERSVSLGLDVFTQGSGRIDVYASATSPGLGDPGNLSLGLDDVSQPVFSVRKTLNLTNLQASSQTYSLSVQGSFPEGMAATVTPVTLALRSGERGSFTFDLYVDNTKVPSPPKIPCSYEGTIVAAGSGETLRIPFAFIKSPVLEVTFDEVPDLFTLHNRVDFIQVDLTPAISRTYLIPGGTYDLITLFVIDKGYKRVIREGVPVTQSTKVNISTAEAVHLFTIIPVDKDGNSLKFSPLTFSHSLLQHKGVGYSEFVAGIGPFTTYYSSPMSNAYRFDASWLTQNRYVGLPTYVFNAGTREGINGPITVKNSPSDFKPILSTHKVDPGVNQVYPMFYTAFLSFLSWYYAWCPSDPPLVAPFEEKMYYIPVPYPEFQLGLIQEEIYSRLNSDPCDTQIADMLYQTPLLSATDRNTLEGYLFDYKAGEAGGYKASVFSTTAERLPLGIGPYSWFGRFDNLPTQMRLQAAVGEYVRLYLGQTRDLRPHDPLPYKLYQNGNLVQDSVLWDVGNPWTGKKYAIRVLPNGPGAYTLQIPYSKYLIAGQSGSGLMEASFDSRKSDSNPPYMTKFEILENGEVTDTLASGRGQIIFKVFDDLGLNQVALYYDAGNGWQELGLNRNGDEYSADFSSPMANTFVSLKVVAVDSSDNRLSYEMRPALFARSAGNETISVPSTPSGPANGSVGVSYSFSTGNAASNLSHSVEYQFDWKGDGTDLSPWGSATQSKAWASSGTYNVRARARCATHTAVVSPWSGTLTVTIAQTNCQADVPADHWNGEYYSNTTLSGSPSLVRDDGDGFLNFDWGSDSPGSSCGIGADYFSVRWTRAVNFGSGNYQFIVTADDGVRLWVDNQLILDKWILQSPTTYTVGPISLSGNHTLKMEYFENAGRAVAKVSWQLADESIFKSGWENGEVYGYSDLVLYSKDVAGYYNSSSPPPECSRRYRERVRSGDYSLMMAGYSQASYAYCYYKVFDLNLNVVNGMKIGYWIYHSQGTPKISVDGYFSDGTTLRDFYNNGYLTDQYGVRIHPGNRKDPMNQWYYVEVNLSKAAGKRLAFIMFAFDNGSDGFTGQYRAYVDDFKIFNSTP
jgi:subtilisin family serine protease